MHLALRFIELYTSLVESGGRMPPRQPPGWRRYDFSDGLFDWIARTPACKTSANDLDFQCIWGASVLCTLARRVPLVPGVKVVLAFRHRWAQSGIISYPRTNPHEASALRIAGRSS